MKPAVLTSLLQARADRNPAVVATRLADGDQVLLLDFQDRQKPDALRLAALACVAADRSQTVMLDDGEWFLHLHAPPPRLILIGAVHISQVLALMAQAMGIDVSVIDPRAHFATKLRFPGATLHHAWPDAALATLRPDRHSAVIALSHDPKIDDPGLQTALSSECGYIGALGSRRSHAARLERLAEQGVEATMLARILGPVGLDIGAVGAAEIAVSILAEWIAVRRDGRRRER